WRRTPLTRGGARSGARGGRPHSSLRFLLCRIENLLFPGPARSGACPDPFANGTKNIETRPGRGILESRPCQALDLARGLLLAQTCIAAIHVQIDLPY